MLETPKPTSAGPILPDVSQPEPTLNWGPTLPWVGMRDIELPLRIKLGTTSTLVSARLDLGVSLDRRDARGIHMSRLYRLAAENLPNQDLSLSTMIELADKALETHKGLSHQLKLALRFSLPLQRRALKSQGLGWRTYPVVLRVQKAPDAAPVIEAEVEVLYSSTCPASAALSRQLNQERSLQHFSETEGTETGIQHAELREWLANPAALAATPHAQRSRAIVRVGLSPALWRRSVDELLVELVEKVEAALGTPVQTLVKREDEQEFARRNAENLMFCEDAARRLTGALEANADYLCWSGEVAHFESLHPHDAVALFAGERSPER